MERNAWARHYHYSTVFNPVKFDSISDIDGELNKDTVSVDSILPDDLLERILASLPIASIFRAGCVCKRWHEVVISKRFLWNFSNNIALQKPWYFMFTGIEENFGCSYDPTLKKWSRQVPGNFYEWNLSIHVYISETMMWTTLLTEDLNGWRAGDESVACGGSLYFLLYSTGGGMVDHRHGLIKYKLSDHPSEGLLMSNFIPAPCSLTCGRLMNLREKLVLVGGIGKHDRSDIIKGIGVWVLNGREWLEVARMPHKYFQGFGEFDDVFASSGTEDVIYIQSYGAPTLLLFDMNQKQWKWAQRCPITKRFPLQLFTGFCFEPRLEVSP